MQKKNLYTSLHKEHNNATNELYKCLSKKEKEILEEDILNRIKFAKEAISSKDENKITRFYILKENENVIGFQTAQIRVNENKLEGWRNYAYIKSEYAGKVANVEDTYGKIRKGFLSNIIYENITQWFQENKVTLERTATGKNMYKNILAYIVAKGFIPEKTDNERVYLIKEYDNLKSKEELKQIYKKYCKLN